MTNTRCSLIARNLAALAAVAVLTLAGCDRSAEPQATADAGTTAAEYAMPAAGESAAAAGSSLKVTVTLSPALASKAAPDDVVFIFARPAQGPRMPIAIVRKQVRDLPATVVLDDSTAMSPEMRLSAVPEVVVIARVSKTGMANAQPGDLEGSSGPVKSGSPAIAISIANVLKGP